MLSKNVFSVLFAFCSFYRDKIVILNFKQNFIYMWNTIDKTETSELLLRSKKFAWKQAKRQQHSLAGFDKTSEAVRGEAEAGLYKTSITLFV